MRRATIALVSLLSLGTAHAQVPDHARMDAQRQAMAPLAFMDGIWRGNAWTATRTGRAEIIQTERIGPFLGGTLRVIEGRGYNAAGEVTFNAFGTISYEPSTQRYTIHSCALGHCGDFPLVPSPTGYVWEIPAGPGAIIRYTATVGNGHWREVGERIAGNAAPVQVFEMNLTRVGDTDWPAGNPVPPR